MVIGFRTWLKEAGITENNAFTSLGKKLLSIGSDSSLTWGVILNNLSYESPIFNWYVRKIESGKTYLAEDLPILLGEEYSATVKKNALSSLKETLRLSPIGWLLMQGECETKGKNIISITRGSWDDIDPIVVLYSLYKFAEKIVNTIKSFKNNCNLKKPIVPKEFLQMEITEFYVYKKELLIDFSNVCNISRKINNEFDFMDVNTLKKHLGEFDKNYYDTYNLFEAFKKDLGKNINFATIIESFKKYIDAMMYFKTMINTALESFGPYTYLKAETGQLIKDQLNGFFNDLLFAFDSI